MPDLPLSEFSLFAPPYRSIVPTPEFPDTLGPSLVQAAGAALVWRPDPSDPASGVDIASRRRGGLALVVILPPAASLLGRKRFLEIIERCRPHTILPHSEDLDPSELRCSLARPPSSLPSDVTDYLAWRGIRPDPDTLRLVRRTLDLSADVRTVSGLARSLYTSRRALGRRFLSRGLPVPSHWLHFGRILRAALRLQGTDDNLFTVACRLGYPDGFALMRVFRLCPMRRKTQAERGDPESSRPVAPLPPAHAWRRRESGQKPIRFRTPPGLPPGPPRLQPSVGGRLQRQMFTKNQRTIDRGASPCQGRCGKASGRNGKSGRPSRSSGKSMPSNVASVGAKSTVRARSVERPAGIPAP